MIIYIQIEPWRIAQSGPKKTLMHLCVKVFFLLMEIFMSLKATTIDEQLQILARRNVKLDEHSHIILFQYGYYNLVNGYKDPFIDPVLTQKKGEDFYKDGTTLNNLAELYIFDAALRRNILSCITIIETYMKSAISNFFSLKYGTNHWTYLTPACFTKNSQKTEKINMLIHKITKSIEYFSVYKPHPSISHFSKRYNQIPLWSLNTILSFGKMANFYDLLEDDLKKRIAKSINPRLTPTILSSILYYLTDIRNKCAHNNRLYIHKIDQRATRVSVIPQLSIHKILNIRKISGNGSYEHGQDDILAALIGMIFFFGKSHVYGLNYDGIDQSLSALSNDVSPDVEKFVRDVTGLHHEYLVKLKDINLLSDK